MWWRGRVFSFVKASSLIFFYFTPFSFRIFCLLNFHAQRNTVASFYINKGTTGSYLSHTFPLNYIPNCLLLWDLRHCIDMCLSGPETGMLDYVEEHPVVCQVGHILWRTSLLFPRCAHWLSPWLQATMLGETEIREAWCSWTTTVKTPPQRGFLLLRQITSFQCCLPLTTLKWLGTWRHAPAIKLKRFRSASGFDVP